MNMDIGGISPQDKQQFMEYMLLNADMEIALKKWKRHKRDDDTIMALLQAIADRTNLYGGVIVSVTSNLIPAGVENVTLFTADHSCDLNYIEGKKGKKYVLIYTSKDKFKTSGDPASGLVMFLEDVLKFVEGDGDIDGIVINYNSEEAVFDKILIRAVLQLVAEGKAE